LAVQLSRIARPIADGLQEAIEHFDCVGEKHDDDPVAREVREHELSAAEEVRVALALPA
jgi:hypothetical protein